MQTALVIIHVVIAVVLTVIVLMQHGKQQGLSGAIAGGAETFFGKNKGRTVDAMLKKFTAVVAILFIISSVVLTAVSINQYVTDNSVSETENGEAADMSQALSYDENGNLVDAEGNIVATAEEVQAAQAEQGTDAAADDAAAAEDASVDGTAADEAPVADDGAVTDEAPADEAAPAENAADGQ